MPGRNVSLTPEAHKTLMHQTRERQQRKQVLLGQQAAWQEAENKRVEDLDKLRAESSSAKGIAPLVMMSLGVLCFFVALLGFVVSSQPRNVWIPTLVVVLGSLCVLPLEVVMRKDHWRPRKVFGRVVLRVIRAKWRNAEPDDETKVF